MSSSEILFYGNTIPGRRQNNEDAFLAVRIDTDTYLLAVADGMGGAVAGEIASKTVLEQVQRVIEDHFRQKKKSKRKLKELLGDAYDAARDAVEQLIQEEKEYAGMGTTLTVLLIHDDTYVYGNIGDSRLYLYQSNAFHQLTRDHTHVQDLIDRGETPDQEYMAAYSNLITKCINGGEEEPDIFPLEGEAVELEPDTAFLLCSDGLILNEPEEHTNQRLIDDYTGAPDLLMGVEQLIDHAYNLGSADNITVVVAEYGKIPRTGRRKTSTRSLRKFPSSPLEWVLVLITALLLGMGGYLLSQSSWLLMGDLDAAQKRYLEWKKPFTREKMYTVSKQTIRWNPYPIGNDVAHIQLTLENLDTGDIYTLNDSLNRESVALTQFDSTLFDSGRYDHSNRQKFRLQIDAYLSSDTTISRSCTFFIRTDSMGNMDGGRQNIK